MIKQPVFTRIVPKMRGRLAIVSGCVAAALVFLAAQPAMAEDWIDPCEGYQMYVAIGGEESGPATALKRVCENIGPVVITQPCLVYYTRTTDTVFPPDDELKAKLAAECEGSMPGGTGFSICDHVDCDPPAEPDAPSGPCRDRECVGEDLVLVPEPSVTDGPPSDLQECGNGLECRPEPDDPPPDAPDTGSANANPSTDPALDLAFWQAIVDSNDPALFQAYLDKFPQGTFAPIAAARLKALSGATPPSDTPAAPSIAPVAAAPPATQSKSPQDLFGEAQAIMDRAYQLDATFWDGEARRAMPIYQAAGDGGWAPAYVELGGLHETGIGTPANLDRALDYFLKAGRLGYLDGFYRALMVLDTAGNGPTYVETFLTLYRIDPDMALDSLDAVGRNGPQALQRYLQERGYYNGALDGDFGPGSRTALAGFISGASPSVTAPVANAPSPGGDSLAAALQQALARVGCYDGAIDGKWGSGSARAMDAFNLWNASTLETGRATQEALNVVSATPGLICGVD